MDCPNRCIACYIDHAFCSGARFSFCPDCLIAQKEPEHRERVQKASTPVQLTAAFIPEERWRRS